ncbi:MAG: family ATPase [Bacteroidetes bacterium]|nr:family ATPase [Bacteroidota bacterium]
MEYEKSKERKHAKQLLEEEARAVNKEIITANALVISEEIAWLCGILDNRINELEDPKAADFYFSNTAPPELGTQECAYANLVNKYNLSPAERLFLISSLVPHISAKTFTSRLRVDNSGFKKKHAELGGYIDTTFSNFVPTFLTVLHLLGGRDISTTLYFHLFLTGESSLLREQIITLRSVSTTEDDTNMHNYAIALAPEYVEYLVFGKEPRPDFGKAFPATLIETGLDWEQLVVKPSTRTELERIMRWEQTRKSLLNKAGKKLNASFTCLFYGPSGGGKTLAVQLIGKSLGINVFRIDLSMVVSKYIGETEKNLAYLFDRAKNKNWILFFDEADALFGKRTDITDSKDKWANLEMSYLLQRMEEHNGLTILASNLKDNIDVAMTRRFQSVVYFNRPAKEERIELWKKLIPPPFHYHPSLNFNELAKYEITGGNVINVIKAACMEAVAKNTEQLDSQDLADAIKREFAKENRFPN